MKVIVRKGFLVSWFGLIGCLILSTVAFKQTAAALFELYPNNIEKQIKLKVKLNKDVYQKNINYLNQSLFWSENNHRWQLLALNYVRLLDHVAVERQQDILAMVYKANMNALALAPVDPYSWFRFAVFEKNQGAEVNEVFQSVLLSYYAGRVEPNLSIHRINFLIEYYGQLDKEMKDVLYDQVKVACQFRLFHLAQQSREKLLIVYSLLDNSIDRSQNCIKHLEKFL